MELQKYILTILILSLFGCSSVPKMGEFFVEAPTMLDEYQHVQEELLDIAQIMLAAGRFHQDERANSALDVCLLINGSPNSQEQIYAQNISVEEIQKNKERAQVLLHKKQALFDKILTQSLKSQKEFPELYASQRMLQRVDSWMTKAIVLLGIGFLFFRLVKR